MALSNVTVAFNVHDWFGGSFDARRAKAWATNNADDQKIDDTSTGESRIGSGVGTIATDGTGTFTHWAPGADGNPTSWQTSYHFDVPDRNAQGGRARKTFGPFTVTGTSKTVTTKALTTNVATIGTSTAHGLVVGNTVTVAISDAVFDGTYTVTATPTATTLSYAKTNANVTSAAATGTLTSPNILLTSLEQEQAVPPTYLSTTTALLDSKVAAAQLAETNAETAQAGAEAAEAAANAAILADLGTSDGQLTAIDGNAASAFRVQSDLRHSATIATEAMGRYTTIDVVADHGADPSGTASSVTAFNAAIAAANALGGNVRIRIPAGTYNLTAGVTTSILVNYVQIVGDGCGATTLVTRYGTLFKFGDGGTSSVIGGGLSHVDINAPIDPDPAQTVIDIDGASSQKFYRIFVDNIAQFARLGSVSGGAAAAPSFRHIYGNNFAFTNCIVFDAIKGSSLSMTDVVMNQKNVGYVSDRTTAHPAPSGSTFLRFGKGSWDTAHLDQITTNRYAYGLDINVNAASAIVSNFWTYGCVFDYGKTRGIRVTVNASGAYVANVNIDGGWAVAQDEHSVEVAAVTGTMANVHFADFSAQQAGKCNWRTSGDIEAFTLDNCRSYGANRLSGLTGLDTGDFVAYANGLRIHGGRFGDPLDMGAEGIAQAPYGMLLQNDQDIVLKDATVTGATNGFEGALTGNTVADYRRLITGNRRASNAKPEYCTIGTITAPASTVTATQFAPTVDEISIYGGTVTDVKHNGATIATAGPVTITLRPGDTWQITYSVAPTVVKNVLP